MGIQLLGQPVKLEVLLLVEPRSVRRRNLPRLFATFPHGCPAVGLLLLRAVIGVTALAECGSYFSSIGVEPQSLVVGLLLAVSGSLLLIGLWTRIASAVFASLMLVTSFSSVGRPVLNPIHSPLAATYATTIAIAVALLGPGAISLDYRLFGPREIMIPPARRPS